MGSTSFEVRDEVIVSYVCRRYKFMNLMFPMENNLPADSRVSNI